MVKKELEKIDDQFKAIAENHKTVADQGMQETAELNLAKSESVTVTQKEASNELYLKPTKQISCKEKFNEDHRDRYNYMNEQVRFIAENNELTGEAIEIWTRPFPGMPAMYWSVPTNRVVWGPRYLAEQISRKSYNRMIMQDKPIESSGGMTYYGAMAIEKKVARLAAHSAKVTTQVSFHNKASAF